MFSNAPLGQNLASACKAWKSREGNRLVISACHYCRCSIQVKAKNVTRKNFCGPACQTNDAEESA